MCKSVGVDPLSSNKGFWVDILGVGDFYYELAVSVVKINFLDTNCKHLYCFAEEKWRFLGRK
jgi:hypothetical protein